MKRKIKCLIGFALVIGLMMFNLINIAAIDFLAENNKYISQDGYVTTHINNNIIQKSINKTNLNKMYSDLNKMKLDVYEKNIAVLKAVGYSEQIIESMNPSDINEILENAESISTEIKYLKSNSDGTLSIISEDEAEEMVIREQQRIELALNSTSSDENGGWSANTFEGCMRITVSSVYINPSSINNQKGWFNFHAWFEWLVLDNQRHRDAISISAVDCAWSDNLTNDYLS